MEKQNELLPGGCLTIVCNLEIFYSDRTTQGKKKPRLDFSPPTETNSTLGDQLSNVFSCGDFSGMFFSLNSYFLHWRFDWKSCFARMKKATIQLFKSKSQLRT